MSLGLALIAGAVEAGVGYPDTLYRAIGHPVTWIGRLIAWADNRWNSEEDTDVQQRVQGIVLTATLVIGGLLIGLLISRLFYAFLPPLVALLPIAILATSLVAQQSLHEHVEAVADALEPGPRRGPRGRGDDRRPRHQGARPGRRLPRRDREPGRELLRRHRGAAVLARAARPAGRHRLQGDQHRRQHDRPQDRAVHRLRLGRRAHRRPDELAGRAARGAVDRGGARCSCAARRRGRRWSSPGATRASTTRPMPAGRRRRWRARSACG